jgi:hypothetical protein
MRSFARGHRGSINVALYLGLLAVILMGPTVPGIGHWGTFAVYLVIGQGAIWGCHWLVRRRSP